MRRQAKKFANGSPSDGSALILTVVLTSLLATVGVLFVMMARVNQIATSGISESRELDSAIETVIAEISEELVLDVPGVAGPDYYDYPDVNNAWLASLEPYEKTAGNYYWRQISDVTGFLEYKVFGRQDVDVELPLAQRPKPSESWVRDYPQINVDEDGDFLDKDGASATEGLWADADGDGVADSKWIELDDITSSKGRPIYAAIRIVDNGGMLNVNTAYKFDPNDLDVQRINGSSQMQINLAALALRGNNGGLDAAADNLQKERCGQESTDLDSYEENVIWRYDRPDGNYTPFDISDELELRNRFILNHPDIDTRIETVWTKTFRGDHYLYRPIGSTDKKVSDWLDRAEYNVSEPNADEYYSYRHIATTYNMDRIINPSGGKMVNVNRINDINDVNSLYGALLNGLDPYLVDADKIAAQIAVNLKDYGDSDSDVTSFIDVNGTTYYGFERPCVYISELAHKFVEVPNPIPGDPNIIYRSYAIELYKYPGDKEPNGNDWRLVIGEAPGGPIGAPVFGEREYDIDWLGTDFHVILFEDPLALLVVDGDAQEPDFERFTEIFEPGDFIELRRRVRADDGSDIWIAVDSVIVPFGWLEKDGEPHSYQRDITLHKCIRRLWASVAEVNTPTLGGDNNYFSSDPNVIQAHPANEDFTNVGEIGMIFRKGAYYYERGERFGRIGYGTNKTEEEVRVDLAKPEFQQIFNYLTVWPSSAYVTDPNEARIKGRININTAPWFVIAQLPWVSQRENGYDDELARAIVENRDAEGSFESIGQLMRVTNATNPSRSIDYYLGDGNDIIGFPDLTPGDSLGDGAVDDFEERDVIFARISNLVTVRSDVFTAYILVRIGTDGPQKRVITILDRSDVYSPTDRVKIVAVHPVPDPR